MTTTGSVTFSVSEKLENGKNKNKIHCQKCTSLILSPGVGHYKEVEFSLPLMKPKSGTSSSGPFEEEMVRDYWFVEDMYSFDNVGFSNTVGNVKYLTCADCEVGPIGWFDITAKTSYVALSRVSYKN